MSYRDPELVGQPLSEREAEVLAVADGGATDTQIAERFGYSSANAAGNVRRIALTKSGRGGEVRRGGGGARKPSVTTAEDMLRGAIEAADATVNSLSERLSEARGAVEAKPAELVKSETDRLTARVASAQAALDAFTAMDTKARNEWVASEREAATARLSQMENDLTEAIEKANAEKEKMTAMAEAIGLVL